MARKQIAMLAALLSFANTGHAFDGLDSMNQVQTVMFYYAFPLDARTKKERTPWMGMQIQGRSYEGGYNVDTRMLALIEESGGSASASLILIGAAALGAAALVGHRGKDSQQQVQQEKQQQQQQQQAKQGQQPPAPPCTC